MKRPEFTKEQEYWMCEVLGDWYLQWKKKIVNYDDRTHSLGFATSKLKEMLCGQSAELVDLVHTLVNFNPNKPLNYLCAPAGKFRVIGVDTFANEECLLGDFDTEKEAVGIAKNEGKDMFVTHVYTDNGTHIFTAGKF